MSRSRVRPISIRLFASAFLLAAMIAFASDMARLDQTLSALQRGVPEIAWTRDLAIVALSARLSIAFIPVALVWFRASQFARWMAIGITLGKLINLPAPIAIWWTGGVLDPGWVGSHLLAFLAVGCLFAPGARHWFKTRRRDNAMEFE